MAAPLLPLVVDPADVARVLSDPKVRVIDVGRAEVYARTHVPGAVHLDYEQLVLARPPALGLLPEPAPLAALLGALGISPAHHVIAYDDETNGRAARLIWTLHAVGHFNASLMNGGLEQWLEENRPTAEGLEPATAAEYPVTPPGPAAIEIDEVRARLHQPGTVLLDTRSPQEYNGELRRAQRAGHIPGAVNYEWTEAMDLDRHLRLRPAAEIQRELREIGVTPDKEVIVYCQTHHRSAHTYVVLKHLGFTRVRGYAGSWSEWGNRADTPIE